MSVVTGLILGLLVIVLGAAGLAIFGMFLANREKPRRAGYISVPLTREEALQLVQLMENLKPITEKLNSRLADST